MTDNELIKELVERVMRCRGDGLRSWYDDCVCEHCPLNETVNQIHTFKHDLCDELSERCMILAEDP